MYTNGKKAEREREACVRFSNRSKRSILLFPTSDDEIEGDGLAAEAVDALAHDDAGVAETDGADLEEAAV